MVGRPKATGRDKDMAHTPGPWAIATYEDYSSHIEASDPLMRGRNNLVLVAEAFPIGDEDDDQRFSNMHLIAAAPDLLSAAKAALLVLKIVNSKEPGTNEQGAIDILEEVIAKATGEK